MFHFCSHLSFLMISSHPIILFCLSLVHCILRPTNFLSTATHKGMDVDLSSGIWTNCQGLHHWRQSLSFPSVSIKCQWLPKGRLGPQKSLLHHLHHAMKFTNLTLYVHYAGNHICCETRRAWVCLAHKALLPLSLPTVSYILSTITASMLPEP